MYTATVVLKFVGYTYTKHFEGSLDLISQQIHTFVEQRTAEGKRFVESNITQLKEVTHAQEKPNTTDAS